MNAIGPWDAILVLVKAITYAATLGAAGGVFFLAYSHSLVDASIERRIRRLVRQLLIVSAVASIAKIMATAASMSGDMAGMFDADLDTMILRTGEGRAVAIRMVGVTLVALSLAKKRLPAALATLGAAAAATSFAWVGHVHALRALALPTAALVLHLLTVAFWLGALGPLFAMARHAEVATVAAAAARFGNAALLVVAALMAAGICVLYSLLRPISDPWSGAYGRLILVKMALVACLLTAAAFNHRRLTPRLLARESQALRALRTSLTIEIGLGTVILLVTAAMTTLTGPD